MSSLQKNVFNLVLFNCVWLICVLGGSAVAFAAVSLAIAAHMRFVSGRQRELIFIGAVGLAGVVVETGLVYFKVLSSADGSVIPPLWLIMLWPLFATTINHSTRWFQRHVPVAILAGGVAGPLTYITGTKLTDYAIVDPFLLSTIKLSIVWMVVFPAVAVFAREFLRENTS